VRRMALQDLWKEKKGGDRSKSELRRGKERRFFSAGKKGDGDMSPCVPLLHKPRMN